MLQVHRLALALIWASASLALGQQLADPDFDTRVTQPAFVSQHPVVVIDEAHANFHTAGGRYKPFADLMNHDGFRVVPGTELFTPAVLGQCQILVIANPLARVSNDLQSSFTAEECDAVKRFVAEGGSLLLITDHPPLAFGSARLAQGFGVDMSLGVTIDAASGGSLLRFDRDKNQLGDHPIMNGRNESERINRVLTFTGQSLEGPPGSTALLKLPDSAVDQIGMERVSAAGRAQGLAFRRGKGRVVVMGEAAELTAQVQIRGNETRKLGMNLPGCDNRQFALNIMHWLAGLLDK